MEELLYNIEKIINSFEEPDYIQLKFLAQYENDPLVIYKLSNNFKNLNFRRRL